MKYLFLTALYLSFFLPAYAQPEQWDTYISKFGGKPGSVLVDMSLIDKAPDKRYPYLVITGPIARKCNSQGMPDKDEIAVLEDILDGTGNFLTGITSKMLAGTFTYNCERVNYYYVKDTMGIRTAMRRMYDRNYKSYEYALNIKYDPEWRTYRTFLYPDEATQNWMENNKIIQQMKADGDSMKGLRDINFDFYFTTDSARNAFETFAQKNGYTIKQRTESKKEPRAYAIVVSKSSAIVLDEINKMTAILKEEATKRRGYYSGWTTSTPGK